MPLTNMPSTTDPAVVADRMARAADAPIGDVLLAQAFGAGTSWTPFYGRRDIAPETWTRWSDWLVRRMAQEIAGEGQTSLASPATQWLARTLDELTQHAFPGQARLQGALRAHLTTAARAQRIWWRAQLATSLASGHLGATSEAEVIEAVAPWLDERTPLVGGGLLWIVPALTAALAHGVLTSAHIGQFLRCRGAEVLWPRITMDPAMLSVPGWRAAWWTLLTAREHGSHNESYADAFRAHCRIFDVAWPTWSAAEITAWWTWMTHAFTADRVLAAQLLDHCTAVLSRAPHGPWLAAQPAFHLALRPLLEAADPKVREIGFQILGTAEPTTPRAPARVTPRRG